MTRVGSALEYLTIETEVFERKRICAFSIILWCNASYFFFFFSNNSIVFEILAIAPYSRPLRSCILQYAMDTQISPSNQSK